MAHHDEAEEGSGHTEDACVQAYRSEMDEGNEQESLRDVPSCIVMFLASSCSLFEGVRQRRLSCFLHVTCQDTKKDCRWLRVDDRKS